MVGTLYVISGPSGVGKSTLVDTLLSKYGEELSLERVTTYTTKQKHAVKKGEVSEYRYMTEQEFKEKINQDFFLEWSNTYGAYYGSPKSILDTLARGTSLIIILDRAGAQRMKSLVKRVELIWVYPPNDEVLAQRLKTRGRESEEKIKKRIIIGRQESEAERKNGIYNYHLCNDSLDDAVEELRAFIAKKR